MGRFLRHHGQGSGWSTAQGGYAHTLKGYFYTNLGGTLVWTVCDRLGAALIFGRLLRAPPLVHWHGDAYCAPSQRPFCSPFEQAARTCRSASSASDTWVERWLVIGPSSGTTCGSQTRAAPGRSPQPVKTGWLSSPGTNSARKVVCFSTLAIRRF